MLGIVYFSNVSENTKRFVDKLGMPALRIPIYKNEEPLEVNFPYVLVTPTYGNGGDDAGVPKQVIKFLNLKKNPEKAYIHWPNRTPVIDKQIEKITKVTRG